MDSYGKRRGIHICSYAYLDVCLGWYFLGGWIVCWTRWCTVAQPFGLVYSPAPGELSSALPQQWSQWQRKCQHQQMRLRKSLICGIFGAERAWEPHSTCSPALFLLELFVHALWTGVAAPWQNHSDCLWCQCCCSLTIYCNNPSPLRHADCNALIYVSTCFPSKELAARHFPHFKHFK